MPITIFKRNHNHKEIVTHLDDLGIDEKIITDEPCLIWDRTDRMIKYRNLISDIIPENSIPRYFKGAYRHFLEYKKDSLRVIEPQHEKKESDSPQSFGVILRKIETLIPKAVPMKSNVLEKIKITILIVFCFAELITLFLIFNLAMGGKV